MDTDMFSTSNILTSGIKYCEQEYQPLYFIQYDSNILYRYVTDIHFNLDYTIIHNLVTNEIRKIYPHDNIYGEDCKTLFEKYKLKYDLYNTYLYFNSLPENIRNLTIN